MSSVNYNVLGLVFSSMHESFVNVLTERRTMGSIPFGGRYRLIDFPLSNFVNSGITKVGVITKSNYGSLLDHIGSGRDWDLSRKKGGLHLLPPYSHTGGGIYKGRLDALSNIWSFVEHSKEKYVILANCDVVTTIDFAPVIRQHEETGADITLVYGHGYYDGDTNRSTTILQFNEDNTLKDVLVAPRIKGECKQWLDMFIISKELLREIVLAARSDNSFSFTRKILQDKESEYKIMGYEHEGLFMRIDGLLSYYEANKRLLDSETRNAVFKYKTPVYTKVGDNAPVKYGLESNIKNSLIADGCIIEGTVENSILFRGVKVGKGAVVKDSVIMQGTVIGDNCTVSSIVADKNVEICNGKSLTAAVSCPLYVPKNNKIKD